MQSTTYSLINPVAVRRARAASTIIIMAKVAIHGVQLQMKDNERTAAGMPKLIRKMLREGAEVVVRATSDAAESKIKSYTPRTNLKRGIRRTGALRESIKAGSVRTDADGSRIEVYPQGVRTDEWHKKPARNAAIGFVTEYGARGVPARGFMAEGRSESEKEVNELWGKMLDEYHRNGGK